MTIYYAGIGARNTPNTVLKVMANIASHLASKGLVLRSGAAEGADSAFEQGADRIKDSKKEIYLPWRGFNHHQSPLHPRDYPFTDEEKEFTSRFHPAYKKLSPSAKAMMHRNTRQMCGMEALHGPVVKPSKFVVCWTENGLVIGGTGQALRIALGVDIPIFNLGMIKNESELELMLLEIGKFTEELIKNDH